MYSPDSEPAWPSVVFVVAASSDVNHSPAEVRGHVDVVEESRVPREAQRNVARDGICDEVVQDHLHSRAVAFRKADWFDQFGCSDNVDGSMFKTCGLTFAVQVIQRNGFLSFFFCGTRLGTEVEVPS